MKIFFVVLIMISPIIFVSCWFQPDGPYDNSLKAKNNAGVFMLVAVNTSCGDTAITSLMFGIKAGKTSSLAMPGHTFWNDILAKEECIVVSWLETENDQLSNDEYQKILRKQELFDLARLDSANWILEYP